MHVCMAQNSPIMQPVVILTRITKNYEFKKGVGIDSTINSTETRILLSWFSLQNFNP